MTQPRIGLGEYIHITDPDMGDDAFVEFLGWLECHGGTEDRLPEHWAAARARWSALKVA